MNLKEQNDFEKNEIEKCAQRYLTLKSRYNWLDELLNGNDLSPNKGILIFNSFVVDRGPDENFIGCWLTWTKKFFQYAVQVDPNTHHLNKIDTWNDITESTQVSAKEPGVGKTFGYLAFEVLKKLK